MTRRRANRISVTITLMVACLGSAHCSTQHITMISDHLYLDTSHVCCRDGDKTVEILQIPPDRPYIKVAYVEAFAAFYAADVSWAALRKELCRQAIEVKADAIIQLQVGGKTFSHTIEVLDIEVGTGGDAKKLSGIAIRYK